MIFNRDKDKKDKNKKTSSYYCLGCEISAAFKVNGICIDSKPGEESCYEIHLREKLQGVVYSKPIVAENEEN